MKFLVLWSGLGCYAVKMLGDISSFELRYNPRVNKVFTHSNVRLVRHLSGRK